MVPSLISNTVSKITGLDVIEVGDVRPLVMHYLCNRNFDVSDVSEIPVIDLISVAAEVSGVSFSYLDDAKWLNLFDSLGDVIDVDSSRVVKLDFSNKEHYKVVASVRSAVSDISNKVKLYCHPDEMCFHFDGFQLVFKWVGLLVENNTITGNVTFEGGKLSYDSKTSKMMKLRRSIIESIGDSINHSGDRSCFVYHVDDVDKICLIVDIIYGVIYK